MRRGIMLAWCGSALAIGFILALGQPATAQDPLPATVRALQTRVASLSTRVAVQAPQISDLQTAVAASNLAATPIAQPDPETLEITIVLRAPPEDVLSDGLGSACEGRGRFKDLSAEADVAIYDSEENLLVGGTLVEAELTQEGQILEECAMTFLLEDIPYRDSYIIVITHRSVQTYSHADLEAMDWALRIIFLGV